MKENLIVLFGGVSSEHDISIISALQAIKNVDTNFYNVIPVYLAKNYKWYVGKDLLDLQFYININFKKLTEVCLMSGSNFLYFKKYGVFKPKIKIDVALPILHGVNGEDGKIASLLTLSGVPCCCSDSVSSAVAIDKSVFKSYLKGLGVRCVDGETIIDYQFKKNPQQVIENLKLNIGYPLIVKPSTLGSSIGISVCNCEDELIKALELGFKLSEKVLVEKFLVGVTEVNVALLFDDGKIVESELEQPVKGDEILSFNNKYLNNENSMVGVSRIVPAPISVEDKDCIISIAKLVYSNLNMRGVVRFDFMICGGEVYLNEVNTIPGSLAFYLFKPKNISYKNLLDLLIKNGYVQFNNLQSKNYVFDSSVLKSGGEGLKK